MNNLSIDLAKKQFDYWIKKLNLHEYVEFIAAAQTNWKLQKAMKRLGYKIPKRKIKLPKIRNIFYVKALEDWYPCYDDGSVAVMWCESWDGISVSGADDFSMEKFPATKKEFEDIIRFPIGQQDLKQRGFKLGG